MYWRLAWTLDTRGQKGIGASGALGAPRGCRDYLGGQGCQGCIGRLAVTLGTEIA